MTLKLKTRLTITHLCTTLLTILIFAVTAGIFTGFFADKYADMDRLNKTAFLIRGMEDQYRSGRWQKEGINKIGVQGLVYGFITRVSDSRGKVIWDAQRLAANPEGVSLTQKYPLINAGQKVGTLEIGYVGPDLLKDMEAYLLTPLNKLLALLALACILISLAMSRWAVRGINAELAKISELAKLVADRTEYDPAKFTSPGEEAGKVLDTIRRLGITIGEKEQVTKRMAADLAHELRTPLTTLQANLEGLLDGVWQPTRERLNSCYEEILRIIRLVGDLEQLTKYETDRTKLSLATFDLGELTGNICLNFQGAYQQKGVGLDFVRKKEMMTGDRDKISQLVVNLLSNSLKHTSPGGKVMLMTGSNQDFVYLVLNDSGSGIPPEHLPRLFDRLYRADNSRTRSTGGSGIGLTIAKAIVEAHRGNINIVSQVGAGTEVTVVLPRTCENKGLPNNDKE